MDTQYNEPEREARHSSLAKSYSSPVHQPWLQAPRIIVSLFLALAVALTIAQKLPDKTSWSMAMITSNGRMVGTILVDTGASNELKGKPAFISVQLPYKGDPMPSGSDMDRFDRFDDALATALMSVKGVNVAVRMADGKRTWLCYAPSRAVVGPLRTKLRKFAPSISAENDPAWSHYRVLRNGVSGG